MRRKLDFLRVLNSPFKTPRLKFYLGKLAYGTPYFFPRRWVKLSKQDAVDSANEKFDRLVKRSEVTGNKPPTQKIWKEFYDSALRSKKAVDKKIGFDLVGLGYKYKWDLPRFEWGPMFSFVFFKWQFCIFVSVPEPDAYWEAWVYYDKETDHDLLSKEERLQICREEFPMIWTSYSNGEKKTENKYETILKKKYL